MIRVAFGNVLSPILVGPKAESAEFTYKFHTINTHVLSPVVVKGSI